MSKNRGLLNFPCPLLRVHYNNKIDSVKIIHDELCGEEYRVLSDFLRLVGIFVCNATYQDNRLDDDKFDLVVYIEDEKSSDENREKIKSKIGNRFFLISKATNVSNSLEYRKKVLEHVFDHIESNDNYLMKEDIIYWRRLRTAFLENDYVKARRFVYFRDVREYAMDAKKVFAKMLVSVSKINIEIQNAGKQSRYIDYAVLSLAYFINECCYYLKQTFYFDCQKLYEEMEITAIKYNDFENYYLLMAFLAELNPVLNIKAERCYQIAASKLESYSYANYAYYRYGRYCEMVLKDTQKARQYYEKAYKVNPKEYRAIYKLGFYALMDKHYEEGAAPHFRKILSLLNGKFEANALQETEYEYYFKACKNLQNISRITGNFGRAEEYSHKADEVIKKTYMQNPLYKVLYGDASERLAHTRARLQGGVMRSSLKKVQDVLNM